MTFNTLARIRTSVLFLCLLFSCSTLFAQSQTINAVYAGTAYEYDQTSDAGEMVRTDYVYYFRPNSSFCIGLDKPDWQKKVDGTYSISGNQLKMKFLNDGSEKIILLSLTGETGQSGAATFIKLNISSAVPTGFYKYVRSSGKQDGFYFADGKFKRTTSLTTVSGGTANSGDGGSFTINQSQLALKFDNGKTTNYSFFTNNEKKSLVVINGDIYYLDEEETAKHAGPATPAGETKPAAAKTGDVAEAGMNLLKQANQTHGGKSLDNLTTLKAVMNTNNLTLTMTADFTRQIVRLESSLQGNPILLEQMEGNSGWSFDGNGYATLTPQRVTELKRYLFCGLLGLRSDVLAKSTATLQTQQYDLSSVMVMVNSMRAGYIISNKTSRLEALIMVDPLSGTTTFTYSDYKKTGNILLPYTEIMQAGKHAQTITYESYDINPSFAANAWAKPK
jgi:hypothetical protein